MYLAALDPRDPEGQEGGLALLELEESRVQLACLEEMDSLVLKGHRAHQESVVQLDQLGSKDQGDYWGQ